MNITSKLKNLHLSLFAGAAAVFIAAPAAEAAIVYVNLATPLVVPNNIDGVYMNVVTGATGAAGSGVAGWDLNIYNNTAGLTFYGTGTPYGILATGTPGTGAETVSLTFGQLISSAAQYNQFQTRGTAFQVTGQEYFGFRFLNEATGGMNYGWGLMATTSGTAANAGFPASLLRYAYENTTGASILAGQIAAVPEPATFAMFGMALAGAAGLSAVRRRRQG